MGGGVGEPTAEENVRMASVEINFTLNVKSRTYRCWDKDDARTKTMDETDQAIERSKQVVHQTIEVGTQTASTLKGQTDQMGVLRLVDTRQVATDKCIMLFLFLIVCGVIAIIVVKIVNPHNKDIREFRDWHLQFPVGNALL
ncbi:hypothetical protein RIF29_09877 [Crotalaria pallida]|uniref:Uncharacterized protein n=1 Tax=Crotalaria pallida TaxID=3830 RepID=A0AAN9ILP3_CROPI